MCLRNTRESKLTTTDNGNLDFMCLFVVGLQKGLQKLPAFHAREKKRKKQDDVPRTKGHKVPPAAQSVSSTKKDQTVS
jgi:hypothetical protein